MEMNTIEWLFFDVGSTLMDEEKAYLHRLHDVADTVNEPFEKYMKWQSAYTNRIERAILKSCKVMVFQSLSGTRKMEYTSPFINKK